MKKLFLFLIAVASIQISYASHLASAEIWYEHDTLNKYTIHLKLYRDCMGVTVGPAQNISVTGGASFNMSLTLDTTYNLYSCLANSCQNPVNTLNGYQVIKYSKDTILPPATNWKFLWTSCCRNPNQTGPTASSAVFTTLDNSTILFNNGAMSPYDVYSYYFVNQNNSINFGAIETDGDSLDHRLTTALNNGLPYSLSSYNAPLTPQSPFPNSALTLNNQTGVMNFTPTAVGSYIIAIETREYRNGVQISSSIRDYQISVIGASANSFPNLSGINNTLLTTRTISACPNANMNFTINSTDPDPNDSTEIIVVTSPLGSSFTTNNAQNQTGSFSWPVTTADVQAQPYLLVLEVRDNNCGVRHKVYKLYVGHCNTDSVWSGDTDVDFTCDNYDVLNIGIANGSTGPVRANATTNWQAEWCANWTNSFVNSMNYKHADCNGDGTVNSSDLAAITANYGSVHNKTSQIGQYKTLGLPDLRADVTNINAHKGITISVPVMLGDMASTMNDIYGISATIELLNAQTSSPISLSNSSSWLGNASNSWLFEKNLQPNKSAFTMVRNSQQSQSGFGQIATIDFPIDISSVNGSKVIIQFSDIKIIKNTGEEIVDYNVLQDTLTILGPLTLSALEKNLNLEAYPNPANKNLHLKFALRQYYDCKILLLDVAGRVLITKELNNLSKGHHDVTIDIHDLASGQYFVEFSNNIGKQTLAIQKR